MATIRQPSLRAVPVFSCLLLVAGFTLASESDGVADVPASVNPFSLRIREDPLDHKKVFELVAVGHDGGPKESLLASISADVKGDVLAFREDMSHISEDICK